jgi:hypothetical protein
MRRSSLKDSGARGWFIGDFAEAVFRTKDFEVCYQDNPRSKQESHIHHILSEITLVLTGRHLVNGQIFYPGDIYILEPGDVSQIEYLEQTKLVTIKCPSIPSDKELL